MKMKQFRVLNLVISGIPSIRQMVHDAITKGQKF